MKAGVRTVDPRSEGPGAMTDQDMKTTTNELPTRALYLSLALLGAVAILTVLAGLG